MGDAYSAVFVEQSHKVLFVAFETLFGIRSVSESGMAACLSTFAGSGAGRILTLISHTQEWFRAPKVFSFFDRLDDLGLFDKFDQVIFYGAGMCGYAAGAFSVTAPGATVLLIAPQATLERQRTPWDDRFPSTRTTGFPVPLSYAPEMVEAADRVFVVFDPDELADGMHASLFQGANVEHFRYHRGSAGAIEADLRSMSLIPPMADAAAAER